MSDFWSDPSSTSILHVYKQWRLFWDCAGLPEPSLVAYVRSAIISWAGSNMMTTAKKGNLKCRSATDKNRLLFTSKLTKTSNAFRMFFFLDIKRMHCWLIKSPNCNTVSRCCFLVKAEFKMKSTVGANWKWKEDATNKITYSLFIYTFIFLANIIKIMVELMKSQD